LFVIEKTGKKERVIVESIIHNDCIIIIQKVEFKSSLASKSTDGTGDTQLLVLLQVADFTSGAAWIDPELLIQPTYVFIAYLIITVLDYCSCIYRSFLILSGVGKALVRHGHQVQIIM
jgi:hypothetical protein